MKLKKIMLGKMFVKLQHTTRMLVMTIVIC